MTYQDIEKLSPSPADHRIQYGGDSLQFGELRLPTGKGRRPVAVIIHGGCWFSAYDIKHIGNFAAALTKAGVATWALEYRRIGNPGGGWPGTFEDVARGTDYLRVLARSYPLDLKRVVAVGHSAGGQLALWLAARHRLPNSSPLYAPAPLGLRGVVSLAGITDMQAFGHRCNDAVSKLLGGTPEELPQRYEQTSPVKLLPLKVPQHLIHGAQDRIVPPDLSREYKSMAIRSGDKAELTVLEGAGHFELIAPQSSAWLKIEEAVLSLLGETKKRN
ncbi:MAG: alpha/beta hydrolase [Acidobacteria bacterium]|nr:alpha/beta hydrolase [Acidobacteriota bacterium]